jgi:hypothetical protein
MCLQGTRLFEVCYEQVAFGLIAGAIYLLFRDGSNRTAGAIYPSSK